MTQTGLPARRTAHHLLMQIIDEGRLMPELIAGGALARLENDDRARAQRLATVALRGLDRADRMLKPYLKKSPPTAS
jgi:16S rRNA (cytosine967-C5)-methyltransferase